jgi:hypothetical protein
MFKIGVICEGPTDFVAMKCFLESEFNSRSRKIELTLIQPALDNSLPAGWTQVLFWLENNKLNFRSALYLKKDALFQFEDEAAKFDALLFHIDSDIIGEDSFTNFIKKRGLSDNRPLNNIDRGNVISHVLLSIGGHDSDAEALLQRELVTPIVESSETWIIAAEGVVPNAEALVGQPLINAFGGLVARAYGKPSKSSYKSIDKNVKKGRNFAKKL